MSEQIKFYYLSEQINSTAYELHNDEIWFGSFIVILQIALTADHSKMALQRKDFKKFSIYKMLMYFLLWNYTCFCDLTLFY